MKSSTDAALIRIQHGDTEGLTDLYELTSRAVFAFVLPIIRDYQLAEDIMQETYVSAYRGIAGYKPGTNGLNWLMTIAKNNAFNQMHRRAREEETDFDVQHETAGSFIERANFDSPTIDLAKLVLPIDEQEILFLYAIGEYKHREIAALLGLPLGTVTWKYQTAIKKMQEHLKKGAPPHEGKGNQ